VTYVLEGALQHQDSLGTSSVIRPGEVQRMSAGTGILHSEYNASDREPVHLLQIWLLPERTGLQPGYEQKSFAEGSRGLRLVGSRDGREGAVTIHQDVELYRAALPAGEEATHALANERYAWVQVTRGSVRLNGLDLRAGDGAEVSNETALTFAAHEDAELLLFDLG